MATDKDLPPIGSKIRWVSDRLGWEELPVEQLGTKGKAVSMRGMVGVVTAHYPADPMDEDSEASFGSQFDFSPYTDGSIAPWLSDEGTEWERIPA